ncbi:MAG: response regulator, partial [Gammaproteobacteria bacterium]
MKLGALIATHDDALYSELRPPVNELDFEVTLTTDDAGTLLSIVSAIPGLLLLDEALPGTSGLELCSKLRRNQLLADIPTIIITSGPLSADRVAALNAGADDS